MAREWPFLGHSETLPYLHLVWRSKNGAILGPFWGHSRAILGPFWGHSRAIPKLCLTYTWCGEAKMGPFWGHSRAILKLCFTYTWCGEAKMGPFWGHFGAILGPFSGHSETLPYLHLVWQSKSGPFL